MNNVKKVLVSGYDLKFWNALQKELEKTGLFEFKQDTTIGNYGHNDQKALELIEWADILIAEWTLNNAVFLAKHKKPHQKLITRFHLQERWTEYPKILDYSKVDGIIFVGAHIMQECIAKFNIPSHICQVVGNFIDMDKYKLPKFGDSTFNIGIIGIVPARKRLDLAFDTLQELLKYHPSYRLHVKGPSPDSYAWLWKREDEKKYYERLYERINSSDLRNHVVFDPAGDDVNYWLQKIGYILSPSDFESFHVAVSEGVSSSSLPIVWDWEGASEIYPPFQLMKDPKNTAKFINLMRNSTVREKLLAHSQSVIKKKYDKKVITEKFIDILISEQEEKFNSTNLEKFKKIIVVYSITNFITFHRKEMLTALANCLDDSSYLLIVEPGSHYKTLLDKNLEDEISLKKFANTEIIPLGSNIGRIKALHGNIPKEVNCDNNLKKLTSLKDSIAYFINQNFKNPTIYHWLYKPEQIKHVSPGEKYIYEVYDEYTMDFATGEVKKDVAQLEEKVLKNASYVFLTSQPLFERKKNHINLKRSKVISNGVVFDLFNKYYSVEKSISNKRKSVGYLGNLSNFFDWKLMFELCVEKENIDFFFHGQLELKDEENIEYFNKINTLPNTYFSGRVTREQGAAAISCYDVLIIPFVINDAMHAVNPLKLWEYFATGKPVISSPMDAIKITQPELYVATNKQDWLHSLDIALQESEDEPVRERRIKMARNVSWDILAEQYYKGLKEVS
ncbi:glycosyltransferase family 4 protein [Neisseria lisongii]|uniref:Glycosyltransferase n=1 Tax=Neisseria lisongii TaxID=2912188 RepID=A0AAW5ANM4_9NEIS|nr:glycosyltransferase [Neisseria lisongii]MCF7530046.1 glycosyltransferase [Neisseria lisongii]